MSYAIIDNLVSKIYELICLADTNSKQANNGVSNDSYKIAVVTPLINAIQSLRIEATKLNMTIKKAYLKQIINYFNNLIKEQGNQKLTKLELNNLTIRSLL